MKIRFLLLLFLFNLLTSGLKAQPGFGNGSTVGCGTSGVMNDLLKKNPVINALDRSIEEQLLVIHRTGGMARRPMTTVTLPVVVHIIHNNGPENISDTRVLAAIQHLNEAFANTGYYNPADGVNTNIQFCLAQRDPSGNATTGITRNISTYTNMNGPDYYSDDQRVKNINRWNPNCFINIWLVNSIPGAVAGYAYLPSSHGSLVDGIIIESSFFGNSYAEDVVSIHEMGHYLGLYHTFEGGCINTDCLIDGDKVGDTPPDNSTAFTSCGIPVNSCTTDAQSGFTSDQNDLTSDYMDYGNWACMTVFTQGQSDRMNWMISNVRNSLMQCKSCLPPCTNPVTAGFTTSAITINVGGTVTFTNTSLNNVTNNWYINNVLQSTAVNFSNTFTSEGQYRIKLVTIGNNTTLCDSAYSEVLVTVSCPVTADFTTTAVEIPVGQTLNFVNTSTGSPITNTWFINNTQVATTQDFSNAFTIPGIYTITLSVGNSLCSSSRTITINVNTPCDPNGYFEKLIASPQYDFIPHHTIVARDSAIIVLGTTRSIINISQNAFAIMKLSKNGNFLWARHYYGNGTLVPQRIIQTNDGNFVVTGTYTASSLNVRPFLMKIDGDGNIIWQKGFYDASITNFYLYSSAALTETSTGDLLLGFSLARTNNDPSKTYLARFNSSGTIIWSKVVNSGGNVVDFTLGNSSFFAIFQSAALGYVTKIDVGNASLLLAKKYSLTVSGTDFPRLTLIKSRLFNNQLKLYGTITAGGGIGDTGSHIFTTIDTFGVIQSLNRVRFTDPQLYIVNNAPTYYRHGTPLKNGEWIALELGQSPYNPFPQKIFLHHAGQSASNSTTRQILSNIRANLNFSPFLIKNKDNIQDRGNGNLIFTGWGTTTIGTNSISGMVVHSSDYSGIVSPNCPTSDGPHAYLPNIVGTADAPEITLSNVVLTPEPSLNFQDSLVPFNTYNICSQNTGSNCYSLHIVSPDTLCVTQDSVTFICRRNTGCTEAVNWSVSAPAQNMFRQVNDTVIKVKFPSYGNFTLTATFASCNSIRDSATVFIGKHASMLNLGPDQTICSFSTAVLHAGKGFKSYEWYNGSADSVNTVNEPGRYYVTVEDYCNNKHSDTIRFTTVGAPPFDIGPDTTICTSDTLILTATAGFVNYTWASRYNINQVTGRVVKVWPAIDTIYTSTATYGNSCVVIDSIRISVRPRAQINLGRDTSFCQGNSLLLDAGQGFTNYQWNNGSTGQTLVAMAAGTYSIAATDSNRCISRDTIAVLNIFSIPSINLGVDTSLCQGQTLTFNAGTGYSSYLWQDNSTAQTLTANNVGLYWVEATNSYGCKGRDSVRIIQINQPPIINLGADTSFCSGQSVVFSPGNGYIRYVWQNNSTAATFSANAAGLYWVEIEDANHCKARDSIRVISLYPAPAVNLGTDTSICVGQQIIFQAGGGYANYTWQDNTHASSITASQAGWYWVQVTNNTGCVGIDSIRIIAILDTPANFIPSTIGICLNTPNTVRTNTPFSQYLWSDGSRNDSLVIINTGDYWVRVTDANQCTATAYFTAIEKQCVKGVFIPTAFSPNNDNLNDIFKATVFGELENFKLQIFNRYGQLIFETEEWNRGWNGTFRNTQQPIGAYVWVCKYKLRDLNEESRKGTVLLIR